MWPSITRSYSMYIPANKSIGIEIKRPTSGLTIDLKSVIALPKEERDKILNLIGIILLEVDGQTYYMDRKQFKDVYVPVRYEHPTDDPNYDPSKWRVK